MFLKPASKHASSITEVKIMKTIITILPFMLFLSCASTWGTYNRYSVDKPANLKVTGERVSGQDCVWFRPYGWWTNDLSRAIRNAMIKAPAGTTGLADVKVTAINYRYVLSSCLAVEGTPVKAQ